MQSQKDKDCEGMKRIYKSCKAHNLVIVSSTLTLAT
uniref:Uncharacterized protein n=1 Tax=Myoviridae sp. ctPuP5 TaxID=2823543 RepID=A0A8S5L9F8_9CAUD|nr:MAG TPA: hypothetical protein [Myoviridae sp. ctPuP5]